MQKETYKDEKREKRANGEGCIYQREDSKTWRGKITLKGADGQSKIVRVSGKTRGEVVAKMQAIQKSECPDPTKKTTGEWLQEWCDVFAKAGRKQTTWESYEVQVRVHLIPGLGDIPLKDLTALQIQKFLNEKLEDPRPLKKGRTGKPLTAYSVHYIYLVLSMALDEAKRARMIAFNPCVDVRPPKYKFDKIKPVTADQVEKFLEAIKDGKLFIPVLVAWSTGIRRGELLGLTWDCIDLEKGTITIKQNLVATAKKGVILTTPKTEASTRMLPIPMSVASALEMHKAKQDVERKKYGLTWKGDFVFCSAGGERLDPRNFLRDFQWALKGAGMPHMRIHDMRHAFASMILDKTGSLKVVQELLGQSCFSVTADTYSHLLPRAKKEALAAVDSVIPKWVGEK